MTAQVIELHPGLDRYSPDDDGVRQRCKDAIETAYIVAREFAAKSPILVVRRKRLTERERNAFELGRDCVRRGTLG